MKLLLLFGILLLSNFSFAQSENDTIPIEIWNGNIVLKATVDGHSGDFIWDNGVAPYSGIDSKIFLNLTPRKENLNAVDGTGKVLNLPVGIAKEVSLGNLKSSNISFMNVDMSMFKTHTKTPIGFIGMSIISQYNWDFHFDKNYVVVSSKPFK